MGWAKRIKEIIAKTNNVKPKEEEDFDIKDFKP